MRKREVVQRRVRELGSDESGAIMVEYLVMVACLVVVFIWLNKAVDTVYFGANPYLRFASTTQTEALPDYMRGTVAEDIAGQQQRTGQQGVRDDKAYLSQIYIHLSRP